MQTELIKAPTTVFIEILLSNFRPNGRQRLEGTNWPPVGLVQVRLIDLCRACDVAEKASSVSVTLVTGNCPQHIQMLAILGKQAAVQQASDKIKENSVVETSVCRG